MATRSAAAVQLYFVIGPLRTGSSLTARCLDDHPDMICFCESEITRTLYPGYHVNLHADRMLHHGFTARQVVHLLDGKRQDRTEDLLHWYGQAVPIARALYNKPNAIHVGDKSPDIYRSPDLVTFVLQQFKLIYTVRDPRAILRSINRQTDATLDDKAERWQSFIDNWTVWAPHLNRPNLIISRYEDLVREPRRTIDRLYQFLGVPPSDRFLTPFERIHPKRFLWTTTIDWKTGIAEDFDPARAEIRDHDLTADEREQIHCDKRVLAFMERFGYG